MTPLHKQHPFRNGGKSITSPCRCKTASCKRLWGTLSPTPPTKGLRPVNPFRVEVFAPLFTKSGKTVAFMLRMSLVVDEQQGLLVLLPRCHAPAVEFTEHVRGINVGRRAIPQHAMIDRQHLLKARKS